MVDDDSVRPKGNNADEWHLFLSEWLDNRAACPNGMIFMAVQIAEAIDDATREAERRALETAANIAETHAKGYAAYRDHFAHRDACNEVAAAIRALEPK